MNIPDIQILSFVQILYMYFILKCQTARQKAQNIDEHWFAWLKYTRTDNLGKQCQNIDFNYSYGNFWINFVQFFFKKIKISKNTGSRPSSKL